ncbi:MAG: hypothetical protein J6T96_05125 [Bacteroidales bacterium]|nr:hypothetical protein [Bacteroidales bacterium]
MALTDEGSGVNVSMPVSPMTYGQGGFGNGDWSWIIILLLFGMYGGWGGNGANGGNSLYPWLLNENTQGGFNQAATASALAGIQSSLTAGFASAEIANCGRALDSLNRSFDSQTAITNGLYGVSSALQNCCCENRANIADLKYTIANEACADRAAVAANTQILLDKICSLELDAKNEKIADLQRQLTMSNLAASQGAQTAAIIANNEAQTAALEQYLAPVPRPAYIVQNPNGCSGYAGGCACGAI